jgi:hypothetical protein
MTGTGDTFRLPRGAAPLKAVQMQSALPGTADQKVAASPTARMGVYTPCLSAESKNWSDGAVLPISRARPRYVLKLWIGSGDGSAAYLPG